jgi:two-component SAPR family response regulator
MNSIIIIDDEEIDCLILSKLISIIGGVINLQIFHHPAPAILYLSQISSDKWPTHIFVDLNLPVMNGFEFIEQYSNMAGEKYAKLFILTSSIHSTDRAKAKVNKNITEYLTKPIRLEKLRQIIGG